MTEFNGVHRKALHYKIEWIDLGSWGSQSPEVKSHNTLMSAARFWTPSRDKI